MVIFQINGWLDDEGVTTSLNYERNFTTRKAAEARARELVEADAKIMRDRDTPEDLVEAISLEIDRITLVPLTKQNVVNLMNECRYVAKKETVSVIQPKKRREPFPTVV